MSTTDPPNIRFIDVDSCMTCDHRDFRCDSWFCGKHKYFFDNDSLEICDDHEVTKWTYAKK